MTPATFLFGPPIATVPEPGRSMPVPFIMERLIDAVSYVLVGFLAAPNALRLAFG
jgi:hypothetical protein